MASKNRRINFYTLEQQDWDTGDVTPAQCIREVIDYVKSMSRVDRRHNIAKKVAVLYQASEVNDDGIHSIMFKSAKTDYSPKLLDRITTEERDNPKRRTEGDGEKTHVVIKYTDDDVYLIVEKNGRGMTINTLVKYLSKFTRQYYREQGDRMKFTFVAKSLAKNNFLAEVRRLNRVILGEVFVDKRILGSPALDFSNRTQTVKHEIIVKVQAQRENTILGTIEDIYNKSISANTPITKIRVVGKSRQNKGDVIIDTSFIEKVENIQADINDLTGEVNTNAILTQLREIAEPL